MHGNGSMSHSFSLVVCVFTQTICKCPHSCRLSSIPVASRFSFQDVQVKSHSPLCQKNIKNMNFHRFMIFSWFFMTFSTSQSSHGFCSWLFHFPHLCIPAARCVATAQGQAPGDASVGSRLWCCCWDRRRNLEKNEASERAWKKAGGSLVMGMARIGRGWFLFFKKIMVSFGWFLVGFVEDLMEI